MDDTHATEAAETTPLTVDTAGLAAMLGMSPSWVHQKVAERAWVTGEIPVPFEVSAKRRLWLRSAVIRWAEDLQPRRPPRGGRFAGPLGRARRGWEAGIH